MRDSKGARAIEHIIDCMGTRGRKYPFAVDLDPSVVFDMRTMLREAGVGEEAIVTDVDGFYFIHHDLGLALDDALALADDMAVWRNVFHEAIVLMKAEADEQAEHAAQVEAVNAGELRFEEERIPLSAKMVEGLDYKFHVLHVIGPEVLAKDEHGDLVLLTVRKAYVGGTA